MSYQLTINGVYRLADSVFIPEDIANRDWAVYQEWLSHGGEPKPGSTVAVSALDERMWRDGQLLHSDGLVARHRDELEAGAETTLSATAYENLQAYRRDLRSWPASRKFPATAHRPALKVASSEGEAAVKKKRSKKAVQREASV